MNIIFPRRVGNAFVTTLKTFMSERSWRMAASITFYLLFMLGPMLSLELHLAGILFEEDAYRDQLVEIFTRAAGEEGGEAVENMLEEFKLPSSGIFQLVVGLWMMLFGGMNAMGQTRESISRLWGLDSDADQRKTWKKLVVDLSFTFGSAFLILASVLLHSLWFLARGAVEEIEVASFLIAGSVYFALSLCILGAVFFMIFRWLPPQRLSVRSLGVGAFTTACLFVVGRQGMIFWVTRSEITSTYGSVSFFVILLLWIYFFCQLILFGASFTHRYGQELDEKK